MWQTVGDHPDSISEPKFQVTKRAVRKRFTLLAEQFKKKMKAEEEASGIDTEMTELDVPLEKKKEKEEFDQDQLMDKAKEEQSKVDVNYMRLKAMEIWRRARKGGPNSKNKTKSNRLVKRKEAPKHLSI